MCCQPVLSTRQSESGLFIPGKCHCHPRLSSPPWVGSPLVFQEQGPARQVLTKQQMPACPGGLAASSGSSLYPISGRYRAQGFWKLGTCCGPRAWW